MTEFSWYMTIQLPNRSEFSGTSQGRGARSKPELLRTCIAKSEGRERVELTLPAEVRFDLNQVLRNRGRSLLLPLSWDRPGRRPPTPARPPPRPFLNVPEKPSRPGAGFHPAPKPRFAKRLQTCRRAQRNSKLSSGKEAFVSSACVWLRRVRSFLVGFGPRGPAGLKKGVVG